MDHDPIAPLQGRDQTLQAGRERVVGESEGRQLRGHGAGMVLQKGAWTTVSQLDALNFDLKPRHGLDFPCR